MLGGEMKRKTPKPFAAKQAFDALAAKIALDFPAGSKKRRLRGSHYGNLADSLQQAPCTALIVEGIVSAAAPLSIVSDREAFSKWILETPFVRNHSVTG